jgi:hypothetical protein
MTELSCWKTTMHSLTYLLALPRFLSSSFVEEEEGKLCLILPEIHQLGFQ